MLGIAVERFANHDAGLRPTVGSFNRADARADFTVAIERAINITESIGRAPDVSAAAGHGEYAVGLRGATAEVYTADVRCEPRTRQRLGVECNGENRGVRV